MAIGSKGNFLPSFRVAYLPVTLPITFSYSPPVTGPCTPAYPPPITNYPWPPISNYPQIPNPAYAPPISYTPPANQHGGNEANLPAENSDEPSRERQGSTSTENQKRSQMAYPCFVCVSQVVVIGPQFCLPYPVD
ncbi:hypothetical protein LguiA_016469 [Lonicera macranthoides]